MWTRWNDIDRMFNTIDLLQSKMNQVFSNLDQSGAYPARGGALEGGPRTNLSDAGDHLLVKAEVAGIAKDDLSVRIQDNYLEIKGKRGSDVPDGYSAHRVERGEVSFTKSFTLPVSVDASKVTASLQNGILTLTLPKLEAAKPKQITIS
jgi:HSP20 family protein